MPELSSRIIENFPDWGGFPDASTSALNRALAQHVKPVEPHPDNASVYNARGVAYGKSGEHDKAIAAFTKAIELKPDFADAYHMRGITYEKKGRAYKALNDYHAAIELAPRFTEAYYARGLAYEQSGDYDLAIEDFTKAIELNPEVAEVYAIRGVAYVKDAEIEKVLERYHIPVGLNAEPSGSSEPSRSSVLMSAAIEDYNAAIALKPDYAAVYVARGNAYCKKGDFERTIKDANIAITLKPDDADAYVLRGLAYQRHGDFENAIADYNTAITLNANYAEIYYNRGEAWLHLQEWQKAKTDLTTAKDRGVDIVAGFQNDYNDVGDFEKQTGIKLPEDIAALLTSEKAPAAREKETRLALALKYYESGALSTGLAARLADVSYDEFLVLIGKHGLSHFGTVDELEEDFEIA